MKTVSFRQTSGDKLPSKQQQHVDAQMTFPFLESIGYLQAIYGQSQMINMLGTEMLQQ